MFGVVEKNRKVAVDEVEWTRETESRKHKGEGDGKIATCRSCTVCLSTTNPNFTLETILLLAFLKVYTVCLPIRPCLHAHIFIHTHVTCMESRTCKSWFNVSTMWVSWTECWLSCLVARPSTNDLYHVLISYLMYLHTC